MKKFLSALLTLNLVLAAVCYATTVHAETVDNSRQVICEQGTVEDR